MKMRGLEDGVFECRHPFYYSFFVISRQLDIGKTVGAGGPGSIHSIGGGDGVHLSNFCCFILGRI